ncbi:hypothetical protein J1C47_15840, partial [Jiella sp. MQZ13P-4]|nr:hypothetical protein [Jiella sonneratiae]
SSSGSQSTLRPDDQPVSQSRDDETQRTDADPVTRQGSIFTDDNIKSRRTANQSLKDAGLPKRF